MSNNKIVKSNHLIQASYKITLQEQRLVLCAVSKIDSRGKVEKRVTITAKEFSDLMCIPLKEAYTELVNAVSNLFKRCIIVRDPEQTETFHWIQSMAQHHKGEARISFTWSDAVVKYLGNLEKSFTDYRLRNVVSLTSTHAIRIYELLMQWKDKNERLISLNDFRFYLGLDKEYREFKALKRNLIDPALTQINQKTNLNAALSLEKDGKRVTGLRFYFTSKKE